jgi:hypothetical protein
MVVIRQTRVLHAAALRTANPNLLADRNPVRVNEWSLWPRQVDHISFSSGGGWVVAYSDGTLRVSMTGTFPDAFHTYAALYLITRGCIDCQQSIIKYVFLELAIRLYCSSRTVG